MVASEEEMLAKAEGSRPVQFPMWPRRSLHPGVRHCCCLGMGLSYSGSVGGGCLFAWAEDLLWKWPPSGRGPCGGAGSGTAMDAMRSGEASTSVMVVFSSGADGGVLRIVERESAKITLRPCGYAAAFAEAQVPSSSRSSALRL